MSHAAVPDEAYLQAIDQLYALGQELAPLPPLPDGSPAPRRKWDLAHMRNLCATLNDPQNTFPSVLIAGTNGKGSTAATLASICAAAGYKTGLYTSPHLVRVNQRIQILDKTHSSEIPDHIFARIFTLVDDTATALIAEDKLPHHPSFFEVLTALAFVYFAEEKVDIAILEVGLGGRLDATNIVEPMLSVITDIALDHQEYLGDTIADITREKAGILRANGTLITLPQHPQANQAIGEAAALLNLHAISAADFIPPQLPSSSQSKNAVFLSEAKDPEGLDISTPGPIFQLRVSALPHSATESPVPRNRYTVSLDNRPLEIDSPLSGHHQQRNIALAVATAVELRNLRSYNSSASTPLRNQISYNISNSAIEEGVRNTRWPGRLEFLPPNLLLDVAHNPAGAWTLRAAITKLPGSQPRTLLFSCLADKDLTEMSRILFPLFDSSPGEGRERDHIVLAPIANPRAAQVEDLLAAAHALNIPSHAAPHLAAALAQARAITPPGGLIIATGSVYLVGAVRELALAAVGVGDQTA